MPLFWASVLTIIFGGSIARASYMGRDLLCDLGMVKIGCVDQAVPRIHVPSNLGHPLRGHADAK